MVLAAGLGTRLRPLTDWVPKPLAWLGDRPQIDHVLAALGKAGFERAVVNTHHLHEAFDDAWAARQSLGVDRVFEPAILGTAGGLHNAGGLLGEGDVLLTNADIVADVDLGALADVHRRSGAEATLVVVAQKPGRPSTIALDVAGRVTRLRKETFGESVLEGDYAGIAILGDALRARLPAEGCLVGDVLLPWLREGRALAGFVHHGRFHDTGSLADYLDANLDWLGERAWYVAPSARVSPGVTLERVVVGSGAIVSGSGTLRDVVIWPGAHATAPLERAIVAPRGVVRALP